MSGDLPETKNKTDVIIVGAGPVGLMLANLLADHGLRILVVEKRTKPKAGSMAIGITPPSLKLLTELGADQQFIERGIRVNSAKVYERNTLLGTVDFSDIATGHPYILSLPQSDTIEILGERLEKHSNVKRMNGIEFISQEESAVGVTVRLKQTKNSEITVFSALYLVGCDGHESQVRQQAGIPFPGNPYRSFFHMADFTDETDFGPDAHIFFGPEGSVESFPLPSRRRRWIIQIPLRAQTNETATGSCVAAQVKKRTGIDLPQSNLHFESTFTPQRYLADSYYKGRVILCGDSAHVMSPIGGQGMNTGFADAAHLAHTITEAMKSPQQAHHLLAVYSKVRRRAFRYAATRVALGMWMGTRTGLLCSLLRQTFIRYVLLRASIRKRLADYFAMLTIPGSPFQAGGKN